MSALALLPGFATRGTALADSGLAPKPPKAPKLSGGLGGLGGLGDGPKSEPAIAEGKGACADDRAEIERLALALMAAHLSTPGCGVTDREKALAYHRAEAMRRLDLIRRRAIDATVGDDPEREAIMGEEAAVMTRRVQPASLVNGLLLAASPLAGVPGAVRCRGCGRGVWTSPSWRGPAPPDLCGSCCWESVP